MAYIREIQSSPSTTTVSISRETIVGSLISHRESALPYSFPKQKTGSTLTAALMGLHALTAGCNDGVTRFNGCADGVTRLTAALMGLQT